MTGNEQIERLLWATKRGGQHTDVLLRRKTARAEGIHFHGSKKQKALTVLDRTKDVDLRGEHLERSLPQARLGHDLDGHRLLRLAVDALVHLGPVRRACARAWEGVLSSSPTRAFSTWAFAPPNDALQNSAESDSCETPLAYMNAA